VHERDALTERRIEHGLAFLDLHFEADGLQAHRMNNRVRHDVSTTEAQAQQRRQLLAC
jgi:hypothetical protein